MKCRFFFVCVLTLFLRAQDANFSFALSSFNGKAKTPIIQLGTSQYYPYNFAEHFLDVTAWRDNWTLWTNIEISSPPRIGPSFAGLRKFRLSVEKDQYSIILGDLYGQIGRGLSLNLWENQDIDWDSSLRGIWFKSEFLRRFEIDLIAGKATGGRHLNIGRDIDPRRRDFSEDESIAAISSRIVVQPGMEFGAYMVAMDGNRSWFTSRESGDFHSVNVTSFKPGFFGQYRAENSDVYFEIVGRSASIEDADSLYSSPLMKWHHYESESNGRGFYLSGSYYPTNWGITLEIKDYLYDMSSPGKRAHLPFRLRRSSIVAGPPSVFKEHSSKLLSRMSHVMDFDDELGFQIEFNSQIKNELFILLNYSRSSRHSSFIRITDKDYNISWERNNHKTLFFPSSDHSYYPFYEGYAELTYRYDYLRANFTIGLSHSNEIMAYSGQNFFMAGTSEWLSERSKLSEFIERRNLITIPSKLTFGLPRNYHLSIDMEHQWEGIELGTKTLFTPHGELVPDSVKALDIDLMPYYYRYSSITIGKASRFSISFLLDYISNTKTGDIFNIDSTQDNYLEKMLRRNDIDISNKWFGFETTLYLTPSTVLTFFYGSIQGGLNCDSGVCVYVPGMDDASLLSFTANF